MTLITEDEVEENRISSIESGMKDAGIPVEVTHQQSYFGFEETNKCFLPDGISYVVHKTLNEGARRKYLNKTTKDIRVQRVTGDAIMKMQSGDEKHALLQSAIVDWNLISPTGQPLAFSSRNLEEFLEKTDPRVVDIIEKEIRKNNTWLMADLSVEDIQKQIDELEEMKVAKEKEEAGKAS